ncbi:hypothetical protein PENTCL1PPCAC_26946 [Pristionchus entomophagus]|uniref:Uncharacterized protein n=1 Tax=Pristionchus entomophagus TaxID=358040 RepID=A0AAV5UDY1_9BILA|nr:hypothetical protein PENTCL1PPCAC_26946 [Pristionchus entomophagus]
MEEEEGTECFPNPVGYSTAGCAGDVVAYFAEFVANLLLLVAASSLAYLLRKLIALHLRERPTFSRQTEGDRATILKNGYMKRLTKEGIMGNPFMDRYEMDQFYEEMMRKGASRTPGYYEAKTHYDNLMENNATLRLLCEKKRQDEQLWLEERRIRKRMKLETNRVQWAQGRSCILARFDRRNWPRYEVDEKEWERLLKEAE